MESTSDCRAHNFRVVIWCFAQRLTTAGVVFQPFTRFGNL